MKNFYGDLDLSNPEICIALEPFNKHNPGKVKCRIPVLMPYISGDSPIDSNTKVSKSNIKNKNAAALASKETLSVSNYVTIDLPSWITSTISTDITNIVPKGQKFIIVFIGGDINNIEVIGRTTK